MMRIRIEKYRDELGILLLLLIIGIVHSYTNAEASENHNYFQLLFVVPVLLAAFRHGFKGGIVSSLVASLIYSPHILLSLVVDVQTTKELMDILLFFAVGIIAGFFAEKKVARIAELEENLQRLDYLEKYTNGIIESIKGGVIALNNDLLVTIINRGAMEILGLKSDVVGKELSEVFDCCSDITETIVASAKAYEINENIEKSYMNNGNHVDIRIGIYPLALQTSAKGFVLIIEDITEIKKIQRNIQRTDRLAALGELSAGIAHEIRNPLAVIKAIAQTMRSELRSNPEVTKELDIINEEVERSNRIIKALMDFAKPDKNVFHMCDINSLLAEVLAIVSKYLSQHHVEAHFTQAEEGSIYCDSDLMKQAFMNIIFNAVEAMPEGGHLEIRISSLPTTYVKINFTDTGSGIDSRNIEKIFNPFFTTKSEGTGLGLSIVHRIIIDHGGVINVSSNQGEGTSFEIKLPVMKEIAAQ